MVKRYLYIPPPTHRIRLWPECYFSRCDLCIIEYPIWNVGFFLVSIFLKFLYYVGSFIYFFHVFWNLRLLQAFFENILNNFFCCLSYFTTRFYLGDEKVILFVAFVFILLFFVLTLVYSKCLWFLVMRFHQFKLTVFIS